MSHNIRHEYNTIFLLLGLGFLANYATFFFDFLHYLLYLCSVLIWVFMLPYVTKSAKRNSIFSTLRLYFIFLIIYGVLNGNYYKYIIFDIHIYTSLIFLTYFSNKLTHNQTHYKLPLFFAKFLFIGVPLSIILFIMYGSINFNPALRSLVDNDDLSSGIFLSPILIATILVPFVNDMKRLQKYIVLLANTMVLIFGVFTATRSFVVISLIAFFSLSKLQLKIKKEMIYSFLIIFIIVEVFYSSDNKWISLIQTNIEYTIARFDKESDYTSGRDTEVEGLFTEFSFMELIFGRGAGAEQKFGFWEGISASDSHGINFTHFGFLNLILKGGFILLFLVYGLSFYSLIILFRYGERKYFFVVLIYLVLEMSHTLFTNYFFVIFLWSSISYALQLKTSDNSKNIDY